MKWHAKCWRLCNLQTSQICQNRYERVTCGLSLFRTKPGSVKHFSVYLFCKFMLYDHSCVTDLDVSTLNRLSLQTQLYFCNHTIDTTPWVSYLLLVLSVHSCEENNSTIKIYTCRRSAPFKRSGISIGNLYELRVLLVGHESKSNYWTIFWYGGKIGRS